MVLTKKEGVKNPKYFTDVIYGWGLLLEFLNILSPYALEPGRDD